MVRFRSPRLISSIIVSLIDPSLTVANKRRGEWLGSGIQGQEAEVRAYVTVERCRRTVDLET